MAGRDAAGEPMHAAVCSLWRTAGDDGTERAPADVAACWLSRNEAGGVGGRAVSSSSSSPSDSLDDDEITRWRTFLGTKWPRTYFTKLANIGNTCTYMSHIYDNAEKNKIIQKIRYRMDALSS